jgi:DNA gyrase/topoisomerase IV subunit B
MGPTVGRTHEASVIREESAADVRAHPYLGQTRTQTAVRKHLPATRTLLRVSLHDAGDLLEPVAEARALAGDLVESLMGRKPEKRFQYIQENARFVRDLDV